MKSIDRLVHWVEIDKEKKEVAPQSKKGEDWKLKQGQIKTDDKHFTS